MPHERVAYFSIAGDDVEYSRREHLAGDLAQQRRRQGTLLGRLDDDRIARHQWRGYAMGRHCDRVVEGDNPADDAIRLTDCDVELVRAAGNSRALQLVAQPCEIAQPVDAG